jgi:hypothetical protein
LMVYITAASNEGRGLRCDNAAPSAARMNTQRLPQAP